MQPARGMSMFQPCGLVGNVKEPARYIPPIWLLLSQGWLSRLELIWSLGLNVSKFHIKQKGRKRGILHKTVKDDAQTQEVRSSVTIVKY